MRLVRMSRCFISTIISDTKEVVWSKRAKWSLVFAIAWAIFDGVRSYSSLASAGYLPFVILVLLVPVNWARTYGLWSFVLWLYRVITRNKSKKALWNARATLTVILAIVMDAWATIHYETETPHTFDWVVTEVIAYFLNGIFLFYGVTSGLTWLGKKMPVKSIDVLRKIAGFICVAAISIVVLTLSVSGIIAFGGFLVLNILGSFIDPNWIPSWLPNTTVPAFGVFLVSIALFFGIGYLGEQVGVFGQNKKKNLSGKLNVRPGSEQCASVEPKPLQMLSSALGRAVGRCTEAVKPFADAEVSKDKDSLHLRLYYTFLYFFAHMTNRYAATCGFAAGQMDKLRQAVYTQFIEVGLEESITGERIAQIKYELWAGLDAADLEYSSSTQLMDETFKPLSGKSLLSKLSRNVAKILRKDYNPEVLIQVTAVASQELQNANLPDLVNAAKRCL